MAYRNNGTCSFHYGCSLLEGKNIRSQLRGAAWLAELTAAQDKSRATRMAAEANFAGLAIGPLLAGLLAQYAPSRLQGPQAR
jgi:hypothetical protein